MTPKPPVPDPVALSDPATRAALADIYAWLRARREQQVQPKEAKEQAR